MRIVILFVFICCCSCSTTTKKNNGAPDKKITETSLVILGTVQDGGAPHIGCKKDCCPPLYKTPNTDLQVVSLGVIDVPNQKTYLFEATPDITRQLENLQNLAPFTSKKTSDGVFLTHAHIGHYSGLQFLGKEALHSTKVPVYAMPKMKDYLTTNGPWSQLVTTKNIIIKPLAHLVPNTVTSQLIVTPFTVPHRDEYSETVGYYISGPRKTALFIPDIDKWSTWEIDIKAAVLKVDYAFIDATFYNAAEVNYRPISEIPHPFIIETMELFKTASKEEKNKIHFIHLNHTNPALRPTSNTSLTIENLGFHVARKGSVFPL